MNKYAAFLVIPVALIGYFVWRVATSPVLSQEDMRRQELAGCVQHDGKGMHIHPHLTITVKGEPVVIPANIGIEGSCMHPIHTHDASGTLHLEFQKPRDVKLGEFFEIWEKSFDSLGTAKIKVNGEENTEVDNTIMHDNDKIEIIYE